MGRESKNIRFGLGNLRCFCIVLALLSGACSISNARTQSGSERQASAGQGPERADSQQVGSSGRGSGPGSGLGSESNSESPHTAALRLSPQESASQKLEHKFLAQAEGAFRAGRLTEPAHDNAYDRFQSVLMLNPQNSRARSGVQAILIRYAEMTRNALSDGQLGSAARLLRQVELYYPANPLLLGLKKDIAKARQQEESVLLANAPENNSRMDYPLPAQALSRRSAKLEAYLGRIAQRLRITGESVMIYARNDAEGRWIYSRLKSAVPGYRVRGDIKISTRAKISILAPLQ